jgi:hypothetical protein
MMSGASNVEVMEALIAAYNQRDADAFADLFAEDAVTYEHPGVPAQIGREAIRAFYTQGFALYPQGRTQILYRVVMGDLVIDHERVQRGPEHQPFDVIAINEVREGLIRRLDLVRKS